jgi:signal transduction histidine kinase
VLALPWLAGLGLRFRARAGAAATLQLAAEEGAARAEQETAQVREIAQLREQQAQLARDVHDVVGHSLAVILAQAESAHYLPDSDPAALKQTMANIATSARSSLQDVRQVLTTTNERSSPAHLAELETLIDTTRASGHDIVSSEEGSAQRLPPELEVVAFRVLQEMLTNAIRHGRRGTTVTVRRRWRERLQLEVTNAIADAPARTTEPGEDSAAPHPGRGVDGMRRRLESVGGHLETSRDEGASGPGTFTATAWIPLRSVPG